MKKSVRVLSVLLFLFSLGPYVAAQSDKIFLEDGQVLAGQLANPSLMFLSGRTTGQGEAMKHIICKLPD